MFLELFYSSMSLHRVIVHHYRYLTRTAEITILELTANQVKLTGKKPIGQGALSKKLNCKNCVPACTRDDLMELKLRRYG